MPSREEERTGPSVRETMPELWTADKVKLEIIWLCGSLNGREELTIY